MPNWNYRRPWYHGSQQELTMLRVGSSVTQEKAIARAFSHRPTYLSIADDGGVKHDGVMPGYLYIILEEIDPHDVTPHPHPVNATRWEWLTTRELRVQLIEYTQVQPEEKLTDNEMLFLKQKQQARGEQTFAEESRREKQI
ncbi:hypothetical protein KSF_092480 [Reticulibacter mediterranei]|uniref:Uncharacterized protein n=1 Tax=Reticulibacter mediterranei TaxID=2778369 RepID=A0A8J3IVE0_9CHLR|nr:hypothetical protein [Reticulibacter mediterranei]GHO99200.1 hypothetical protein KSF_092480 [Reticulibacter mediterranei]